MNKKIWINGRENLKRCERLGNICDAVVLVILYESLLNFQIYNNWIIIFIDFCGF